MRIITTRKIKTLLKEGKKVREIAQAYGISRQAVYCHLNKRKRKSKMVFSKPKKNYNSLIDWKIYNEGLVKRGEILLDFEIFSDWDDELKVKNQDKPGRPYEYPNSFIYFLLRLKGIFKIDYRCLEGITRKIIVFIPGNKKSPDYTTLQNRFSRLGSTLKVYEKSPSQEVAGDSTGLKTSNRGEYRLNKYHGKRKEFIKMHIMVNTRNRQVVACLVTKEEVADREELVNLVSEGQKYGPIEKGLFDAGYDSKKNYEELAGRGIKPVIRPCRNMKLERIKEVLENDRERRKVVRGYQKATGRGWIMRLETLKNYLQDKEKWKRENGYGQRWKSEGRYSVFKRLFGEYVFSKKIENQRKETILKVSLMNLFTSMTVGALITRASA